MDAPAKNLAALVQLGRQHPGLRVFHNLLYPGEQSNVGAVDIAPSVMSRS
jgi:hypothetical protein